MYGVLPSRNSLFRSYIVAVIHVIQFHSHCCCVLAHHWVKHRRVRRISCVPQPLPPHCIVCPEGGNIQLGIVLSKFKSINKPNLALRPYLKPYRIYICLRMKHLTSTLLFFFGGGGRASANKPTATPLIKRKGGPTKSPCKLNHLLKPSEKNWNLAHQLSNHVHVMEYALSFR